MGWDLCCEFNVGCCLLGLDFGLDYLLWFLGMWFMLNFGNSNVSLILNSFYFINVIMTLC